jgi:hypothetical protein
MDAGAQIWRAAVRGELTLGTDFLPGTDLGFDSELGLDRREYLDVYYLVYYPDTNWRITLDYLNYDESGNSVTDRELWASGETILADVPLSTDMDIKALNVMAGYKLHDYRGIDYGLAVGLIGVDGESRIFARQSAADPLVTDLTIKDDWSLLMPTVGGWWKYLSRTGLELSIDGRGTWLRYKGSGAKYIDTSAYVAYYFMDNLAAYGAYRYAWLDGKDDDVDFKIRFMGPALGFWFKF